jgi:hypothetical protein
VGASPPASLRSTKPPPKDADAAPASLARIILALTASQRRARPGRHAAMCAAERPDLARSYLILSMQIRATTCRNIVRGKKTFWLHDLGRSGAQTVRRRSLVIKELPRTALPVVFLATPFRPFCGVFAGHQPFAADTPT